MINAARVNSSVPDSIMEYEPLHTIHSSLVRSKNRPIYCRYFLLLPQIICILQTTSTLAFAETCFMLLIISRICVVYVYSHTTNERNMNREKQKDTIKQCIIFKVSRV